MAAICRDRFKWEKVKEFFKKSDNILMLLTLLSVILAVCISIPLRSFNFDAKTIYQISMPGVILMNMLKMLILPLVTCSLLSGLTTLNLGTSGRMGGLTIVYYVSTTFLAACLGIILVMTIRPGEQLSSQDKEEDLNVRVMNTADAFVDLLRNVFPENIVQSLFQQVQTDYITKDKQIDINNSTENKTVISISTSYANNTNFLGLIFFTIFFGITTASLGRKAQLLVDLIQLLNQVTIKMMSVVLLYVPIGVFFLVLTSLLKIGELASIMQGIGLYMVTVLTGLAVHSFIVLPLICLACTRKNPYRVVLNMSKAMTTGFIIQSSSATLPVTFQCMEEKQKVDSRVTRFMLPIGAIVNMDGTGLYEAIAAIFIAQLNGITLTAGKVVTISMTATLAAIGAATVPSAGLVTLLIVLTSAGLPINNISLLYSLDWFLDRCRTSVNVLGDAFGVVIVEHFCKHILMQDHRKKSIVDKTILELEKHQYELPEEEELNPLDDDSNA